MNQRIKSELERIVKENWPVDGPFTATLDEVAAQVCSYFGMPSDFLNLLCVCAADGFVAIIKRKDDEELTRLAIRMYLSGLLQGAKWQKGER
ncbi:MAG: hypothetical protein HWN68_08190 [Desulfobacterales bacterium]|nr:hypothetical protein [Desulfobacterales bacterium]